VSTKTLSFMPLAAGCSNLAPKFQAPFHKGYGFLSRALVFLVVFDNLFEMLGEKAAHGRSVFDGNDFNLAQEDFIKTQRDVLFHELRSHT
jgi:hypothetical protein